MKGIEDFTEYGDKLIKFGKLVKNPKAKLQDLIAAGFECGLIVSLGLTPDPRRSLDMECEEGKPNPAYKAYLTPEMASEVARRADTIGVEPAEMAGVLIGVGIASLAMNEMKEEGNDEGERDKEQAVERDESVPRDE